MRHIYPCPDCGTRDDASHPPSCASWARLRTLQIEVDAMVKAMDDAAAGVPESPRRGETVMRELASLEALLGWLRSLWGRLLCLAGEHDPYPRSRVIFFGILSGSDRCRHCGRERPIAAVAAAATRPAPTRSS
jgi:hypothetical protein